MKMLNKHQTLIGMLKELILNCLCVHILHLIPQAKKSVHPKRDQGVSPAYLELLLGQKGVWVGACKGYMFVISRKYGQKGQFWSWLCSLHSASEY